MTDGKPEPPSPQALQEQLKAAETSLLEAEKVLRMLYYRQHHHPDINDAVQEALAKIERARRSTSSLPPSDAAPRAT